MPVSVAAWPLQIAEGPLMPATGGCLTDTAFDALAVHPFASVAVTVYVPADVTLTPAVAPPVLHRYVPPPVAVSVPVLPAQMLAGPLTAAAAPGSSLIARDALAVQPFPPVTVTV